MEDALLEDRDARRIRRHHWEMLGIAVAVIVLSLALRVNDEGGVAFFAAPNWPLPPSCLSRSLFHVNCPGCGLTRSFVLLAHGDRGASMAMHRIGWILALAVAVQIPYRALGLWRGQANPLGAWTPTLFSWTLIALLIGNWIVGVVWKIGN